MNGKRDARDGKPGVTGTSMRQLARFFITSGLDEDRYIVIPRRIKW